MSEIDVEAWPDDCEESDWNDMVNIPINDDDDMVNANPADSAEVEPMDDMTGGELRKLREERDSLFERLARATADYRNSQRRLEQDKEQAVQYANSSLIKSLLPVIDNFERALAVDPAKIDATSILKGMQIIHDQWMDVLKSQDVEEVAPNPGTPFDPTHHEALMQQPSDKYADPTVTQLLQKGYMLHGRTLRPAGVAVSRGT
ncbi:MAG: nucleotide exchange factor GrpE [Phycisphaerales bacterium]|nr:nucleotide exchange factor GrpE [Phycisphaerales bacterium]